MPYLSAINRLLCTCVHTGMAYHLVCHQLRIPYSHRAIENDWKKKWNPHHCERLGKNRLENMTRNVLFFFGKSRRRANLTRQHNTTKKTDWNLLCMFLLFHRRVNAMQTSSRCVNDEILSKPGHTTSALQNQNLHTDRRRVWMKIIMKQNKKNPSTTNYYKYRTQNTKLSALGGIFLSLLIKHYDDINGWELPRWLVCRVVIFIQWIVFFLPLFLLLFFISIPLMNFHWQ